MANGRESDAKLRHIYRDVCKDNKQCVKIGDFNHGTIDWDIYSGQNTQTEKEKCMDEQKGQESDQKEG